MEKRVKKAKEYLAKHSNLDVVRRFSELVENASSKEHWIIVFGVVSYIIWTFDFIPDVIPVVGFVDDLLVITVALECVLKGLTSPGDLKKSVGERLKNISAKKSK